MLLLHQVGSVKIGEVVRYYVTYTPAHDRILPAPEYLYLRIRNTSNSALRAAFVHGPYTLYVDAYPAHFSPNEKFENPRHYGVPEFEPMLKAGGSWACRLVVPESIRHDAGNGGDRFSFGSDGRPVPQAPPSASWIINVSSQVIFSTSAAVHYEVLLARDPKSLDTGGSLTSGIPAILGGSGGSNGQALLPGRVSDYQRGRDGRHPDQPRGVFSRAIRMQLEDTAALWNKPQLPGWDGLAGYRVTPAGKEVAVAAKAEARPQTPTHQLPNQQNPKTPEHADQTQKDQEDRTEPSGEPSTPDSKQEELRPMPKRKKVHLVVLTHGLHSNLGGDMLFLKESIDTAVKQAKIDRVARKARELEAARAAAAERGVQLSPADEAEYNDDDEEEVIVRGYSGNATRTERGIKYLGKRLARYVLSMTYPDQPFLPSAKSSQDATAQPNKLQRRATSGSGAGVSSASGASLGHPSHRHSPSKRTVADSHHRPYKFTQISFISHSLGGLVQTYAVAYLQKHSPEFFDLIKPIHFIALASPFLGLNHENPMYVKFALDFGLVGRTGQDLGLTWRAPTLARSGWGALVSNLGENTQKKILGQPQPESKPLLRILPTGPAHTALKKFRNRTVYSNVVNDGIVPLRTSCLLFLDWQGLGRVEKARQEAGLVETVVRFGWAELTGANVISPREDKWELESSEGAERTDAAEDSSSAAKGEENNKNGAREVPQPSSNAIQEDDRQSLRAVAGSSLLFTTAQSAHNPHETPDAAPTSDNSGWLSTATTNNNPFSQFLSFLKGGDSTQEQEAKTSAEPPQRHRLQQTASSGSNHNKQNRIYQRSQTLRIDSSSSLSTAAQTLSKEASTTPTKPRVTTGPEPTDDGGSHDMENAVLAPPKTSFFESATDVINPKMPSMEYIIDPSKRPRTIFHDRVYHPSDIPPPPLKSRTGTGTFSSKRRTTQQDQSLLSTANDGSRSTSPVASPQMGVSRQDSIFSAQDYDDLSSTPDHEQDEVIDSANIRVEEKIARAYHRGLSWRKVLVKLEPDAHNNIIVRRAFANAFGWPVMKHLVEAHFSDSVEARTADADIDNKDRALPPDQTPDKYDRETRTLKEEPPASGERPESRDTAPIALKLRPATGKLEYSGADADNSAGAGASTGEPGSGATSPLASPRLDEAGGFVHLKVPLRTPRRRNSVTWSDHDWEESEESEGDPEGDPEGEGEDALARSSGGGDGKDKNSRPSTSSAATRTQSREASAADNGK